MEIGRNIKAWIGRCWHVDPWAIPMRTPTKPPNNRCLTTNVIIMEQFKEVCREILNDANGGYPLIHRGGKLWGSFHGYWTRLLTIEAIILWQLVHAVVMVWDFFERYPTCWRKWPNCTRLNMFMFCKFKDNGLSDQSSKPKLSKYVHVRFTWDYDRIESCWICCSTANHWIVLG